MGDIVGTNEDRNEDVSETMYKETLKAKELVEKSKLSQAQIETKVNRISDAFLAVLEEPKYKDEHLQNIITAHVSKVPPALEAGLEMIGRLQSKNSHQLNAQPILTRSSRSRSAH
jgi:elongator complex protein 1